MQLAPHAHLCGLGLLLSLPLLELRRDLRQLVRICSRAHVLACSLGLLRSCRRLLAADGGPGLLQLLCQLQRREQQLELLLRAGTACQAVLGSPAWRRLVGEEARSWPCQLQQVQMTAAWTCRA